MYLIIHINAHTHILKITASRKCWLAHVNYLRKELDLQVFILERKLIKEALDRRECEEFEMALRHKSKLRVYKELKRGVGFEEYLRYVKGPPSRLFFKFLFGYPWAF